MSVSTLPQAPGAGTAKTTGILSIVFGILCFPVGLVLAVIALVQHNKAKAAQAANPEGYQPVGSVGLVTGIIGLVMPVLLFFIGIVAAIAIPALLGQRDRARSLAARSNLSATMSELMGEYDRLALDRTPREAIPAGLESKLQSLGASAKNPWNPASPAFNYTIEVVEAATPDALTQAAEARATEKGVAVFVISLPDPSRSNSGGFLAGAVRVQTPVNGKTVFTKVLALD
jgi:type II secretory pathway pseudopilin PulG